MRRISTALWLGVLALIGVGAVALAPIGPAAAEEAGGSACGVALSGPIYAKWLAMGGEKGALGCPADKESGGVRSPQGSSAREAVFSAGLGGAILWHESGPHAGQTYAVTGCAWRLYFQYGGPGGWLGLPLDEPANNPDGQHQRFEGGVIALVRTGGGCEAIRGAPAAPAAATVAADVPRAPLDQYLDAARGEYLTTASVGGARTAVAANYQRVRTEAYVFTQPVAGTVPLRLYSNEALGDNFTTATDEGQRDAAAGGYEFQRLEGWVWPSPQPGTTPLKLYYSLARHDHLLTATPEGEADAASAGYAFVRIEGYALTAP